MHDLFHSAESTECGYRLHKLEVYNWGTFDSTSGAVHVIRPAGATTLLIGQNGSGKSTLVDALLTLLVRPNIRNYNVAAGAKKRERDERSYIKGACGSLSREDDNRAHTEYLRPGNRHYSAVLACFRNDRDEVFTLAQFLYLTAEGGAEKVYCFAEEEKSIAQLCGGLTGTEKLRRQIGERGFQVADKYIDYHRCLEKKTGIRQKAMDVFNQTVAVKDIQSLNDFIRTHMLEASDRRERIDDLQSHFVQLTEAYTSLVRVRLRAELLKPIVERGEEFRAMTQRLVTAEAVLAAAGPYFNRKRVDLLQPVVESTLRDLAGAAVAKLRLEQEVGKLQDEARRLQNDIEHAGGDRLREIPLKIDYHRQAAAGKRQTRDRFRGTLLSAGLRMTVDDAAGLAQLLGHLPSVLREMDAAARTLKETRDAKVLVRGDKHRQFDKDRRELEALGNRQTKLPEEFEEIRRQLCQDLRLPESELRFAAELVAVAPAEREWEASVEKVLRGFALSLLVRDRYYGVVSTHLDRHRVRDARGRGQRLVYLRVADRPIRNRPLPSTQSLLRKLRWRENHPLVPWMKGEIEDRYDYQCCNTVGEFQAATGLAITRERHVKSGPVRHEKDDRDKVADPRNFVLGWDNKEKRRHLAQELGNLDRELKALDAELDRLDSENVRAGACRAAAASLLSFNDFDAMDVTSEEAQILALENEQNALEEGSEVVKTLKARLAEVMTRQRELATQRDDVVVRRDRLQQRLREARQVVDGSQKAWEELERSGNLARHLERFPDLDVALGEPPLDASNVFNREIVFREGCRGEINRLRDDLLPLREDLCSYMSKYLREFREDQTDLDSKAECLDAFCAVHQQIEREDLPRHEQRFKERLNEKVLQEIGFLNGTFQTECGEIRGKIALLNESLRQLTYRPSTYMRLEPRPVRDLAINEFQASLRECLANTFEGSLEADEARYVRIAKLLERLREDERWRNKVTDVRNWFDFAARELEVGTGIERACYEDSTGQSGGEKSKLAFTILVAAIAYQYDIDPSRPDSNRFHFVVVDEMFAKVDDSYSDYALRLFRKFGLQLLIVAPLDAKARVTEPYVGCYLHVAKDGQSKRSEVIAMTAEEFVSVVAAAKGSGAPPSRG